ncbi:MAG: HAMP domain-containing sensor histidine kinase [Candidatus Dormibacteria bacterium]
MLPGSTVRYKLTLIYGGLFLVCGVALTTILGILWGNATGNPAAWTSVATYRIANVVGRGLTVVGPQGTRTSTKRILEGVPVQSAMKGLAAQLHNVDFQQLLIYCAVALVIATAVALVLGWITAGRVLRPLRTIAATTRRISATNLYERLNLQGPDDELVQLGGTIDQLFERLDKSFQAQRRFVANAAHELRTPLATMRASLDVAAAKPGPVSEPMARLARRLNDEVDRTEQLLEGLLQLARAQTVPATSGDLVDLNHLVADAVAARRGAISKSAIDVRIAGCPEAAVLGTETMLGRMVENVVDNAVRHNPSGGWIRIEAGVAEDVTQLVIENGGPKLTPDAVGQLGEPFRRLGADRTGSARGSGLGLSIVSAIAESHGGRMILRARQEGGLRVLVELPRPTPALAASQA